MADTKTTTTTVALQEQITLAIQHYVKNEVEKAIKRAKDELESKIPEITASVGIQVGQFMEAFNNEAVIQIRLKPRM